MTYPPAILSKRVNYRLWESGLLGNRLRVWRSFAEWERSGFGGLVALRYLGEQGGRWCVYDLTPERMHVEYARILDEGANADRVMVNETAPYQDILIQGEYLPYDAGHWNWFLYSRAKMQMRPALKEAPERARGLRVELMLRHAMTASSWEDFDALRERYPDHVFEVSVYRRCLGNIPGRNALVWEVRRY